MRKKLEVLTAAFLLTVGSNGAVWAQGVTPVEEQGEETEAPPRTPAELHELRHKLHEAEEHLAKEPNDAEGWATLGKLESRLGHHHRAVHAFEHAARLAPGRPEHQRDLARAEIEEGEELMRHARNASARHELLEAVHHAEEAHAEKLKDKAADLVKEANNALDPSLATETNIGLTDGNHFDYTHNILTVPMRTSELSVLAGENTYSARSRDGGAATLSYVRAGLLYNLDPNWSIYALAGTAGTYEMALHTDAPNFQSGFRLIRDFENETPTALATGYKFLAEQVNAHWALTHWLDVTGDWSHEGFTDSSNQVRYNLRLAFTPVRVADGDLSISYIHSGLQNDRYVDDALRFAPANLQTDSFGLQWEQHITHTFQYRLAYYHSLTNGFGTRENEVVGLEAELGEGSKIGIEASHGPFRNGCIPEEGLGISPANYNFGIEGRVAF